MPASNLFTCRTLALALCAFAASGNDATAAGLIAKAPSEAVPLHLGKSGVGAATGSGGPSIVRTIVGLAIVIGVIWGVTWLLRQLKSGRQVRSAGEGLASMASLPLGAGRSLQLVRAGREYVLLGVAEHGVVPIQRYSEAQAQAAGLLLLGEENPLLSSAGRRPPAASFGAQVSGKMLDRLRQWSVRA